MQLIPLSDETVVNIDAIVAFTKRGGEWHCRTTGGHIFAVRKAERMKELAACLEGRKVEPAEETPQPEQS